MDFKRLKELAGITESVGGVKKGQKFYFYLRAKGKVYKTKPETATEDISSEKMKKWNTENISGLANKAGVDYETGILQGKYDYGWKVE